MLVRWSGGDAAALPALMPLVYAECRRMAAQHLRHERREHTLERTALVHELYLRLIDQRRCDWKNRAQFYGIAAQIMRRILVDYARGLRTRKRDASRVLMPSDAATDPSEESRIADVLAIDDALHRLAMLDPDQHRVVELRCFAGLSVEETAHVMDRSPRTVKREWRLPKAWLFR